MDVRIDQSGHHDQVPEVDLGPALTDIDDHALVDPYRSRAHLLAQHHPVAADY